MYRNEILADIRLKNMSENRLQSESFIWQWTRLEMDGINM